MRVFLCGSCGAPIDSPWTELVIVCPYCGVSNYPGRPDKPVPLRIPVDGRPRVNVGGRTYVVEGQLAQGDSSSVFRGRWVVRLGELVVIKVQRAVADGDLMRREWDIINELRGSDAQGASHYVTRLPSPIAFGSVGVDPPRLASIYGWKSGFIHSLDDVRRIHLTGVEGRIVVWFLKRVLEMLGWLHRSGFAHGAVVPSHVMIHPRDQGANLVGFSVAARIGQPVIAVSQAGREFYAEDYEPGRVASPETDIAMACRCASALGGWASPNWGAGAPEALRSVLQRGCAKRVNDAWELRDALVEASLQDFGAPAYNPLPMPGWAHADA